MIYIIMCGGRYKIWDEPRQLLNINGEVLIERTIRLLRENGVKDIFIEATTDKFNYLNLPIIRYESNFYYDAILDKTQGYWVDAFCPLNIPATYIMGDVYFSEDCIEKIVKLDTDDTLFYGTQEPFSDLYIKYYQEPIAFKVFNQNKFKKAIQKTKELCDLGKFNRHPIAWELWEVYNDKPLNELYFGPNYIDIHDYTCDIDTIEQAKKLENILNT